MRERQTECAALAVGVKTEKSWKTLPWVGAAACGCSWPRGFFPCNLSTSNFDGWWWHLKTGKWIVENHFQVPQKDIFTYTAASYDWDNHEWLSEALMYKVWQWAEDSRWGGWRTLIVLKALLLVATYLLLGRFVCQRAGGGMRGVLIALFVVLLTAAVGRRMFWPRPPVLSNFFFVFYLYVLWLHRSGRLKTPWLFVLPFLMPCGPICTGGFCSGAWPWRPISEERELNGRWHAGGCGGPSRNRDFWPRARVST